MFTPGEFDDLETSLNFFPEENSYTLRYSCSVPITYRLVSGLKSGVSGETVYGDRISVCMKGIRERRSENDVESYRKKDGNRVVDRGSTGGSDDMNDRRD